MKTAFLVVVLGLMIIAACGPITTEPGSAVPPASESLEALSITFTSDYGFKRYRETITISPEGDFEYRMLDYETNAVRSTVSRKLSGEELSSLKLAVEESDFFTLPADLSDQNCMDGSTEYLEVRSGSKSHKTGGYCVNVGTFGSIRTRLYAYIPR